METSVSTNVHVHGDYDEPAQVDVSFLESVGRYSLEIEQQFRVYASPHTMREIHRKTGEALAEQEAVRAG